MENEIEIAICQLFTRLSDPALKDPERVTDGLMQCYSNPSSIPILFNLIRNNNNRKLGRYAAIGLSTCLAKCFSGLTENYISNLWNTFFEILMIETDEDMIELLFFPVLQLFELCHHNWSFIISFIQGLLQSDFQKCVNFTARFLIKTDSRFMPSLFEFSNNILALSLQSAQRIALSSDIFSIFGTLCICLMNSNSDLEKTKKNGQKNGQKNENNINEVNEINLNENNVVHNTESFISLYSAQLSNLFAEILASDLLKSKLNVIEICHKLFNLKIQPLSLEIVFVPIVQTIQNQAVDINLRSSIAYMLSSLLSIDDTKFDDSITENLFLISIDLSLSLFDASNNPDDPDSSLVYDLMSVCLLRLIDQKVRTIVLSLFNQILNNHNNFNTNQINNNKINNQIVYSNNNIIISNNSSFNSALFTSLMLINVSLQRANYLFNDVLMTFVEFCLKCFNCPHPGVQHMASSLFVDQIETFIPLIEINISEIIGQILISLQNNVFEEDGYRLLICILENSSDCSSFFELVYSFCINQLKSSSLSITSTFIIWTVLATLLRSTEDNCALNHFDEIYSILKSFIYQNTKLESPLTSIIIECIGSLATCCQSRLIPCIPEIFPQILNVFSSYDLHLRKSLLNCLYLFIQYIPGEYLSEYVDVFLQPLIQTCLLAPDLYTRPMAKTHISNNITPSINLLVIIVSQMPFKINSGELLEVILRISVNAINGVFIDEVVAGADLFIACAKLIKEHLSNEICATFIIALKEYVPMILSRANEESGKASQSLLTIIYELTSMYGVINLFSIQQIIEVFDNLLGKIENCTNLYTNELTYVPEIQEPIQKILINFICFFPNSAETELGLFVKPFIPRLMNFLNLTNPKLHEFSIIILSQIIIKSKFLIEDSYVVNLFERSINVLVNETDSSITRPYLILLISFHSKYPQILIENSAKLCQIIDNRINNIGDLSIEENQYLLEYLLAFFAIIDSLSGTVLSDQQRILWFLSRLPLILSKEVNSKYIFSYFLQCYPKFPEVQGQILQLFASVFVSPDTIKQAYLPQDLAKGILSLIIQSGIISNNENALSKIFNFHNDLIQSFLETISQLLSPMDDKDNK